MLAHQQFPVPLPAGRTVNSAVLSSYRDRRESRRAEDQAIFERYAADRNPAVRAALVERFMPMARHLAQRYHNVEDIEDLEQVAALGLLKAIDRFDPARGLAFSSFAFPTVLGELKRHLRDLGWSVRVPRDVQDLSRRLDRLSPQLTASLARSPTVAELAEGAGCTVEQVLEARQVATARHAVSLDQPQSQDDDPATLGDRVASEETGFAGAEDGVWLDELMRVLPARDRMVVTLRFRDDLLQSEIGERLGISQMQVSRILRAAIARLQEAAARERPSLGTLAGG